MTQEVVMTKKTLFLVIVLVTCSILGFIAKNAHAGFNCYDMGGCTVCILYDDGGYCGYITDC
jgi:hypothetical protein